MSPFKCSLGYQPPLFPTQEDEIAMPSVQAHLYRCHKVWKDAHSTLVRSTAHNQRIADSHQTPAPNYQPGQEVWLSSKKYPITN